MEKIKFVYLKKIFFYSLILGAACGIFSLVPYFMPFFSLFFLPFLGSVVPFILLVKKDGFYSSENLTYIFLGALSGFCLSVGFFAVFVPFVLIIHLINKNYYDYGMQYLNLFLFVLFFAMIALVYVVINAGAGLLFGIVYKYIKEKTND